MSDLKSCPICGKQLKVYGPEDWKPSFYDPDGGGDPYCFVCDCGFHFDTDTYDYQEAVERANRRANDESELKKCPFCGNPNVFVRNVEYDKTLWIIECRVCHSEFTVKRWIAGRKRDNRSRVIKAWNGRANDE